MIGENLLIKAVLKSGIDTGIACPKCGNATLFATSDGKGNIKTSCSACNYSILKPFNEVFK